MGEVVNREQGEYGRNQGGNIIKTPSPGFKKGRKERGGEREEGEIKTIVHFILSF